MRRVFHREGRLNHTGVININIVKRLTTQVVSRSQFVNYNYNFNSLWKRTFTKATQRDSTTHPRTADSTLTQGKDEWKVKVSAIQPTPFAAYAKRLNEYVKRQQFDSAERLFEVIKEKGF